MLQTQLEVEITDIHVSKTVWSQIYLPKVTRWFCSKDVILHVLWHKEKLHGENSFRFAYFTITGI